MAVQLIFITTFIFLLLLPPFSTGRVAKLGCQEWCGNVKIPYPFGVGSNCWFNPYFEITCNTSTDAQKAYLSIFNTEVIEITGSYIRVKYPNLVSVCYDLSVQNGAKSYNQSMTVDLSGTPYTLSEENLLTAIGCDDMVLKSNGSWASGGCSAFCADKNDTGGLGYCPNNRTSLGNGCCQSTISGDGSTGPLGAELIDMSGKFARTRLFPCSYAFIQEWIYWDNSGFSYPLYYLDNSTAFLDDNWASAPTPPVVRMGWSLGAKCSVANLSSTACLANKSFCFVDTDAYSGEIKGQFCRCVDGYEGNPYLPEGCVEISSRSSSSTAKPGCRDQCGKISIPFPFGIGSNCYREPSFEIICNDSTNPSTAYLAILKAEIIQLTNSSVLVQNPKLQVGLACYNLSDSERGMSKTEERSLSIDLSATQFALSDENWLTALGCDDMVVGIVGQTSPDFQFINSGCASICWDRYDYGQCPFAFGYISRYTRGCCSVPIPRGTTYLEANLSDLSGQRQRSKFSSCSYAFVNYKDAEPLHYFPLDNLNNSTAMQELISMQSSQLMLDWRIGQEKCKVARQNQTHFACQGNSDCVDFDAKAGGYLCNCLEGYQGNPYLTSGCQDIDECADDTTNPCHSNSVCINTPGSFNCLCPKGYSGDGRKDGTGCIHQPQAKIIFIGLGSGLGFLLVVLIIIWLYKVWQKRRQKLIKEKFFKRNGGLLLQQQTNENVLGETKVFRANELEVATDNFNQSRIIGQGGQGTVYKGMLSNGKIVAIKKSKLIEENQVEPFINEVVILSQINHKNIVKLLGCCLETEVPLLVFEFMPNGTVFDLIHYPNNEFPFIWDMRLKIAADLAGALAYLHSASSVPIYHRDIKSSNLLMDEKYVVKVSDFGTSRSIAADQSHLTTMVKGTFGYLDPEYFQSSQFTEKSDVYSFGVVLVELLTGQRPISLDKTDEERGLAPRFLSYMEENGLDTILDPQVLKECKKEVVITVARLAQRCLNLKGKMRPNMKEVSTELESLWISQMPITTHDEIDEVRDFDDLPTSSDIHYSWTTSYKSFTSSMDTDPFMLSTE